ncbi:MAG TPA: tetratricopeptide repeat protein [Casimicrobiaceae bacterium]|nr:tetratricopeptide repeat protein [Casimicrobiaceae bacterium]
MAQDTTDFSARLDKLWDYGKPAESRSRFEAELAKHPAGSREALETTTQIARTQSLQRNFADADTLLDAVLPKLDAVPARVKVRYFLERGRTRNSSGDKPAAAVLFKQALAFAPRDTLPGADFYRVDALHMLGIAAPQDEQLDWNLKALAAAEASSDPRARGWAASLDNNIGWTYFDRGDVKTALVYWEKALPLREAAGKPLEIRIAKWTIARGYRAVGRLDDAEKIQLALAAETERIGEPDGYIYEELAEIALARGNATAATPWAAKAYALLKDDGDMRANEAARLARLQNVAQGKAP